MGGVLLCYRINSPEPLSKSSESKMNPSFTSLMIFLSAQVAFAQNQLSWAPPGPGDGMYSSFVLFKIFFVYLSGLQKVPAQLLWM